MNANQLMQGMIANKGVRKFDALTSDSFLIAYKTPPERQLDYLKKRGLSPRITKRWDDFNAQAHDKAFTVAGVLKADLLQHIFDSVLKAKELGHSVKKFQDDLLPKLEKSGWAGATPGRLKNIYITNMQVTYGKARYEEGQLLGSTGIKKYRKYLPSSASEPDSLHKKFYNLVLPYDDPFWKTYTPPSRFGCQCGSRMLSEAEVQKLGLNVSNGVDVIKGMIKDPETKDQIIQDRKGRLNLTKAWAPDTNKYISGIREQLNALLERKKQALAGGK